MNNDKVLSLLGLCQRAGKLGSGEFICEKTLKQKGEAKLVILAEDASENTKDKFISSCNYNKVPIRFYSDKESIGHAIGKGIRASIVVLDQGFADNITKHIDAST